MHTETVTIQRTFRVVRHEEKVRKWTEFSFETSEHTVYTASVYGHPPIREAMQLTVAVPRKGAWSEISGWFDHVDGCIRMEGIGGDLGGAITLLACVGFTLFMLMPGSQPPNAGQMAGLTVMLLCALFGVLFFGTRLIRKLRARNQLRRLFPDAPEVAI